MDRDVLGLDQQPPLRVNTAAEQSARSLMLGLKDDRRSTAPISSATPVSREMRTCSDAG